MRLFANIEHEVDELRRDVRVCELTKQEGRVKCTFVNDKCIIVPGTVRTKEGKGYTVSSNKCPPNNIDCGIGLFTVLAILVTPSQRAPRPTGLCRESTI